MADTGEASSAEVPVKEKPVVVRVKRKSSQATLDAFWLEINERPLKRLHSDLGGLSISGSTTTTVKEEPETKKLLVQHVKTINNSEAISDILQSLLSESTGSNKIRRKIEERKHILKQERKQDKLRSAAREKHEDLVKSARFEQIWRSRKSKGKANDDSLLDICHLYDVVRVDAEEEMPDKMTEPADASIEDNAILCNYLPLIRECLPKAAAEIESDMIVCASKQDGYVYDIYTVESDTSRIVDEDILKEYPLVHVNDGEDYYDGLMQSDYETDDSNAEDNPLNDYPEEESSEDEDEHEDPFGDFGGSDSEYEKEVVAVNDEDDADDSRWGYR